MMRRLLFLAVLLVGLPLSAPVQAQATADQLNRLSLEALTARPSGGGYERRNYGRAYPARGGYHGRSYHARRYGASRRFYARPAPFRHHYGRSGYRAFPHAAHRWSHRR